MNRPASDPQGFGHKTDSPIPKGAGFCRGPAPPRPLVEQRGQSSIFVSNEFHLFFPRHAASLPAASCLFKLFFLRALAAVGLVVSDCHANRTDTACDRVGSLR